MKRLLLLTFSLLIIAGGVSGCLSFSTPLPALDGAEPVPDITLPTPDGEMLSLSDYQGQVIFLNFWGTYCPPCVAELPDIQNVYEALQDQNFVVIGLNVEEKPEKVKAFITEHHITFPIIISPDATVNPLYQLKRMPTTWFIDREGILRGKIEGQMSEDMALKIARKLLEEQP